MLRRMLPPRNHGSSIMPSLSLALHLCSLLFLMPLISTTCASPILVPDLQQCHLATDTAPTGTPITRQQNCCLPVQQAVNFSFASYTPQKHVRRCAQFVPRDYIVKYIKAYELMRALPPGDPRSLETQANLHCAFCNGAYRQAGASSVPLQVHFSWLFLPWHRWYLYFHERILAKLLDDPDFSLVYWNWDDQQDGGNMLPGMFARNGTSLYDERRDPEHVRPAVVELVAHTPVTDPLELINVNLNAMYQEMMTANYAELFMGGAARTGTDLRGSTVLKAPLGGSLENGAHNAMHLWTGNPNLPLGIDMATFINASRDPVFYAHHSNVDRLWEVWHTLPGGNRQAHTDPDFLNAQFYFYDENAQLVIVTVRDALNNTNFGISYEPAPSDQLWMNYEPPATSNGSAVTEAVVSGVPMIGASPENGTIGLGARLVALVARPTGKKPSNTEEVLTIQGVDVPARSTFASLVVFVNLPNATNTTSTSSAEYVGTLNVLSTGSNIMANWKLEIGDNLKRIGIDDEDQVVITLAVKGGFENITIEGMIISYEFMS